MENMLTDEYMIESSSADPEDDQEQEMDKDIEETANGSEQEMEPEESDQASDLEEAGTETILECSCDMSELAAYMETLQCDVLQMVSSLDAIRMSCTSVIFLLLFIWAEKKIKNAVIKFSGGKKNANID